MIKKFLDTQLILNQTTHLILNQPTNTSLSQSTNTSLYQFHDLHLLCFFVKTPGDTWHIAIPTSLLDPIINS